MSAPASQMIITNIGSSNVWCGGIEIVPNAQQTYTTTAIQTVCSDVNFWAAFLAGSLTITLNGQNLSVTLDTLTEVFIQIAVGNIIPS